MFLHQSKIDNLTKQVVYDLLSAPTKESIFNFDNSLYCQINGVAMCKLPTPFWNQKLSRFEGIWGGFMETLRKFCLKIWGDLRRF